MEAVFVALRGLLFTGAMVVVAATSLSAVRTFVLPRAANTFLSRLVFVTIRTGFDRVVRRLESYERQDAVMALLPPSGCSPSRSPGSPSSLWPTPLPI